MEQLKAMPFVSSKCIFSPNPSRRVQGHHADAPEVGLEEVELPARAPQDRHRRHAGPVPGGGGGPVRPSEGGRVHAGTEPVRTVAVEECDAPEEEQLSLRLVKFS